jgi:hypothetical protein
MLPRPWKLLICLPMRPRQSNSWFSEILKRNPGTHGILFDMPHAFEGGQRTVALAGLVDRCEVVSGDFFASVPGGADVYLLSRVIHDWDDEKAIAILKVTAGRPQQLARCMRQSKASDRTLVSVCRALALGLWY